MAYRRSLTTKARLFAQQRFTPSISYVHRDEDRKINQHSDQKSNSFLQNRAYSGFSNTSLGFGGGVSYRDPRWSQFLHVPMFARNMSTAIGGGGEAEKLDYMYDMADVLADNTMMDVVSTHAPAVSEVAVAAADSWMPIAAVQYAIDGVHNFTGLNWWGSIVITTLIVRTLTIPLMISRSKAITKLSILIPQIDQEIHKGTRTERLEKIKRVLTEHGVTLFTPLTGLIIQGSLFVCFCLAIQNMVDKVPSFKTGGTSWFLDLTTADPFYLLPCLTAFSFWKTIEFFKTKQEYLGGNPADNTIETNVSRAFGAALIVPLIANFPTALFCYGITFNLFSLVYGLVTEKPSVKKMLNIPILVPPPAGESKPAFSLFEAMKNSAAAEAHKTHQAGKTNPTATNPSKKRISEDQKSTNQRETRASVLSQRIKRLEKEVKGRKKNKKRI